MKKLVLIAIFVLLINALSIRGLAQSFPTPTGIVNDYTNTLSEKTRSEVELILKDFEQKTGHEVAVVMVETIGDTTIEDYAVRLFEKWRVGKAKQDNGLLFLIAKNDRQLRIEVGYGLEGSLTDLEAKQILDEIVAPTFRTQDFDTGVREGVQAIISQLSGEVYEQPLSSQARRIVWDSDLASFLLWAGVVLVIWFFSSAARSKSWWLGGVAGGGLGVILGLLTVSLFIAIVSTAVLSILGLVIDYFISRQYRVAKRFNRALPWWVGGQSFGWFDSRIGGGGRSFGGFGGGSSGGGGASGSW